MIDEKFKNHKLQYFLQCAAGTLALIFVLFYMNIMIETVIVASIGATSFIIFTMPHKESSCVKFILGGYLVGGFTGVIAYHLFTADIGIGGNAAAAIAVGFAMFLMVMTNTEHPPAAAFALGIAVYGYDWKMLFFVFGVNVFLLFFKGIFRRWMIDLI